MELSPSISLGVGVKGVASLSLRGAMSITLFIGVTGTETSSQKLPHVIVGISAGIYVDLQLIFFTKKWELTGFDLPNLYNSWQNSAQPLGGGWANPPASLREIADGMQIVTAASLAARSEGAGDNLFAGVANAFATPTAYLVRQDVTPSSNGGTYTVGAYRRITREEGLALLGEGFADAGTTNSAEQQLLYRAWKAAGLLPVWDSALAPHNIEWDHAKYAHGTLVYGATHLSELGGLFISSDTRIAEDVLSDSRSKIVSIWDNPYVLRLAVKTIGGQPRARITAQRLSDNGSATGRVYTLDFDITTGVALRSALFDYNFDVVATTETLASGASRRDLHFLVLSGIRESDDDTPFIQASVDHVCTYVRWSFNDEQNMDDQSSSAVTVDPEDIHAATNKSGWCHLYTCPQVRVISDDEGSAVVMSYLDRAGATADDVFEDTTGEGTSVGIGMFFVRTGEDFGQLCIPDLSDLRDAIGSFADGTICEMTCSDRTGDGYHTVMLRGANNAHYLLVQTNAVCASVVPEALFTPDDELAGQSDGDTPMLGVSGITSIVRIPDEVFAAHPRMQLVAVPNQPYFLTAACTEDDDEMRLMQADWVIGSSVSLSLTDIGPKGFAISNFCIDPSGEYIYWPTVRHGKDAYDYDDDSSVRPQADVQEYLIMACRLRKAPSGSMRFSEPFILAQLDHPVDTLVALENTADAISMVGTHVVDAATAQGDVYFTVVGHVLCASIASAEAVMPAVAPKDPESFYVAITNNGNTYLRGATIEVEGLGQQALTFSEQTIVESSYNPRDDDGNLQGVEEDYALAPGKTSMYEVSGFVIPEDWEGEKDLLVSIVDNSVVPADTETQGSTDLFSFAEGNATGAFYVYNPSNEEMTKLMGDGTRVPAGQTRVVVSSLSHTIDDSDVRDAPITSYSSSRPSPPSPPSPVSPTSNTGRRGTPLPRTSDPSAGVNVLSAALGLAGAAMIAYSRRRTQIESECDDE